jgi:hypothetical protein
MAQKSQHEFRLTYLMENKRTFILVVKIIDNKIGNVKIVEKRDCKISNYSTLI